MILITSQSSTAFAGVTGGIEDPDGDNIFDPGDNCPNVYNPGQEDEDNDGKGDVCDIVETIEIESDVNDDLVVGPGDVVIISNGATVDGNLQVNGGTVFLTESSTIKGNLESNGGTIVIEGSKIEGNVKIEVSGAGGVLEIDEGEINGTVETNGIDTLTITNSDINGNIYSENDSDVTITGNTVNGNLEILGPSSCSESSNNVNGNNSGCP